MKEMILFSGGPDALIAWEYLKRPTAFYIQHGCKYEEKQLRAVSKLQNMVQSDKIRVRQSVLDLGDIEEEDSFLPMRNMFFVMIVAGLGFDKIWLALQRGEQSIPDRSAGFTRRMSEELSIQLKRPITVDSPFWQMTKSDMVAWYIEHGHDVGILKETVSCFHPTLDRCGECAACFRRWCAFESNGIHEEYTNDITKWSGIQEYIKKMQAGEYEERRTQQTLEFLEKEGLL